MADVHNPNAPMLEQHTIGFVPASDRHGKVRDLFTLWFGTNIAPLPIVTGALGPSLFGLNLWWSLLAFVVGHVIGGALMALHSAQGPQMGIPQMIQSRGQFGTLGALIIVVIAAVMYLGFFASNIVLAGQSIHGIASAVPVNVGIIAGAVGSAIICIIGYRLIHFLNRIGTWVLGIAIVGGFIAILTSNLPADFLTRGGFNFAGWLATVSLGALWQIAFAPYVSDYSRYLPKNVGVASTFWTTYLGCVLGSFLAFAFGAVVALAAPVGMDTMDGVKVTTGALGTTMLVLFVLSVISHNALNLYGAVLSIITSVQTFRARWIPTAQAGCSCPWSSSSEPRSWRSRCQRISSRTSSISLWRCWWSSCRGRRSTSSTSTSCTRVSMTLSRSSGSTAASTVGTTVLPSPPTYSELSSRSHSWQRRCTQVRWPHTSVARTSPGSRA